jgi:transposase
METGLKVGIDISKSWFDVAIPKEKEYLHKRYNNDQRGFEEFVKDIPGDAYCIMEASGVYYLKLALFLHQKSIAVSVVNPLVIKRFAQMRMVRAKTDKKDAVVIAEYGKTEKPELWNPKEAFQLELQQMAALLDNYIREHTRLLNQREAFVESGVKSSVVMKSVSKQLQSLSKAIKVLEGEMDKIIKDHYQDMDKRIKTIPGIGPKASTLLLLVTDGFTRFDNSKQLSAYLGLSPRIYESGSRTKGKSRICKMGMEKIRAVLYMCAMKAKSCNKACKEMYERFKTRGKNGKVILIAIANKLIRQAFAIAKSQINYQ